jgi:DNA-directed RNA polymerase specialized sigma24 family protein
MEGLDAFEVLVWPSRVRWPPRVRDYRVALHMLRDRGDAEDAVPEAFLVASERLEAFASRGPPPWSFTASCTTACSRRHPHVALEELVAHSALVRDDVALVKLFRGCRV